MTNAFVGEIKIFAGNFAPRNFALCNGAVLAIQQNAALFSILGTTYGGNGQTTFQLPDMQSRFPMHWGQGQGLSNRVLGEVAGVENTTLLSTNMPQHFHQVTVAPSASSQPGTTGTPGPTLVPATSTARDRTYGAAVDTALLGTTVNSGLAGGSQPFGIMPPYLCVTFIIALFGIFPARN